MPANDFGEVGARVAVARQWITAADTRVRMPLVSTSPRFGSIKVSSILSKQ
jgi:hypothetical protein